MKYEHGMKRYSKGDGGSYKEDKNGQYYKAGDGKMYRMQERQKSMAPTGVDKPGDKPGQADDHAHEHPDDDADYPGAKDKGGKTEKGKKSMLTQDDLQKTLDEIEDLYKAEDPEERRKQLLQKSLEGDLTADEHEELLKALRGGDEMVDADPPLAEQLIKGMGDNKGLQKALDVSEYLDEQHGELVKSLGTLAEVVEQSDRRQHDFNLVLAKATHQVGTLVKGMSERLGIIESQPARAPKSRGVRAPQGQVALTKSFVGGDGTPPDGGGEMSKGEILDTMCDMMEKSETAPCGESVLQATAKYEQTGQMSKAMASDVIEFRRENAH